MNYQHTPVLLKEVLEFLDVKSGQSIVDATLGGGGYSRAILEKIGKDGRLLAIDLDKEAIESQKLKIKSQNLILHQGNFANVDKAVMHHKFPAPDGIVADLGLSSYELDQAGRGMSFQKEEVLDMRFDQSSPEDAKFILNNYDENRLTKIFENYGEEKFSGKIAREVIKAKSKKQEVRYTTDLYQIIQDALPKPFKHKTDDSARRIFQALRIEVNHELQNLEEFLPKAFDLLKSGGRMVVVSFHSLEDRIVKQYFAGLTKGCVCPPDFPICQCGKNSKARILTKKPVIASEEEIKANSRSRPAKLRAIMKI
jgi:16S rRNA (cytosine1402-N4)-methyltransferase